MVFAKSEGDFAKLIELLSDYDSATAAQAAHLYHSGGRSLLSADVQDILNEAGDGVKQGFRNYIAAWRKTQIARSRPEE